MLFLSPLFPATFTLLHIGFLFIKVLTFKIIYYNEQTPINRHIMDKNTWTVIIESKTIIFHATI